MTKFARRFGGVKAGLLAVAAAAVVSYAGYRLLFARTGEAATALIPADASIVVTLDTHPSENQLAAFTKLSNALKREGLDTELEKGVNDIIGKAGLANEVRQYLTHNLASAWWSKPGQTNGPTGIVLFSINNAGAVGELISSGKKVDGAQVPAYTFGNDEAIVAVVGEYLAVSKDLDSLNKVVATKNGAASIAGERKYQEARAALPDDANLMVFVAPTALSEFMGQKGTDTYMAYGASLRNGGIQFDYRGPVDRKNYPALGALSQMSALDPNLLKKLPPDALGVVAQSSMDKYFTSMRSTVGSVTDASSVDKEIAEFETETGISVEKDILPAFQGDTVLAVYPTGTTVASLDVVLLVDNANGANPGPLVDKFRAFLERKTAEEAAKHNGPALKFVETKQGQTTVWRMDEASRAEIRKAIGGNDPSGKPTLDPRYADKSLSFAMSNGSLLIASSDAMMNKALVTLNGDRSLADDTAFQEMQSHTTDQDQFMLMCSLSRVIEHFRNDLTNTMGSSTMTVDDLINLFGGKNTGMVGSYYVKNDAITGTFFLPLDFDRLAKVIHEIKEEEGKAHPISEIPPTVAEPNQERPPSTLSR